MNIIQDIDEIVMTRLPEILKRETANLNHMYLYIKDDAVVAFQRSAYLLQRVCPNTTIGFVRSHINDSVRPIILAFINLPALKLDFNKLSIEKIGENFRAYRTLLDSKGYDEWKCENILIYRPD